MGIRNHKKLYSRRIPRLSGGAEEMLHTRVEARKGLGEGLVLFGLQQVSGDSGVVDRCPSCFLQHCALKPGPC